MEEVVADLAPASDKCARCLQPVASNAPRCPHCGQPINNPRRIIFMTVAAAGVLAMVFMLVVMYRVVYLSDLERAPLHDEHAAQEELFSEPNATSQDAPPPPKDSKPSKPAAPEKPPPFNR